MTEEYEERGIFKQLVLIAFAAYAWCGLKAEKLWDSEGFWWFACVAFVVAALLFLKVAVVQ